MVSQLFFTEKDLPFRWSQVKHDFWGDLKERALKSVKNLIETFHDIEIQDLIGAARGKHLKRRPTYRCGFYTRTLQTSLGYIPDLKLSRVRDGHLQPHVLDSYARRSPDLDQAVLNMFLAGVCTRRVKEVLAPLAGDNAVSSSTVSNITKLLDSHVRRFHDRPLADNYLYLILDGIYLNMKSPIRSKRRCILVAYGIKANGIRELIAFRMANQGESQAAWEAFLNSLYRRGLEGALLKLIVIDGNKGLANAAEVVYPSARIQRCWAHKLRNAAHYVLKKYQPAFSMEASAIYAAPSRTAALAAFKSLKASWNAIAPKAVACLEEDLDTLLSFFSCPEFLWKKLRTTNIIERIFREVRRRTRPMSTFNNLASVERIIFAIFHRQNAIWGQKRLWT
jgi:transposase-like protein